MVKNDEHQRSGNGDLPSPTDGNVPALTVDDSLPSLTEENRLNGSVQNGEKGFLPPDIRKGVTRRRDAYEVDFSDTREFAAFRWMDIMRAAAEKLTPQDLEIAAKYCDWEFLADEIQRKLTNPTSMAATKRQMGRIQPIPRVLSTLTHLFENMVAPQEIKFDLLWGLIYLNLRLSYDSPDRLKRTAEWLNRIRQVTELFNRCIGACEEPNEARIGIVDFLDPIVIICMDSVEYLHECSSDSVATEKWPELNDSINEEISVLNATVKHVGDITSFSKVNMAAKVKNMSLRYALTPETEEPGTFPNLNLPFRQNPRFYGRSEELERINKYLSPKDDQSLRTYTIYGRRGVGKTEVALQFAYTNQAGFDAIFWVRCESLVSIRQSFTDIAVSLNLPGADKDGHHEENLLAVHDWLKKTSQAYILQGYWPVGASGAILITSRKYFNFSKDTQRRGDTIKPFDPKQSWDLLLQLLGDDWKKLDREGRIPQSEIAAAKLMLGRLGGLALAIQQAAILIKNDEIGGPTIVKTYEMFEKTYQVLPRRLMGERGPTERGLDTLWDMTFNSLTNNARVLLGVLAWLSPDGIPVQLFLPQNQRALDGRLRFCRQNASDIDEDHQATKYSLATTSSGFDKAVEDLLQKELIKQDGLVLSIHRVVQEATNYHDKNDLQESFNSASSLVYEAFPRQILNQSLYKKWNTCQDYIAHGVHLRKRYSEYARTGQLKASTTFVRLLHNCACYLFEISDQDTCARITETALSACDDKSSLLYAELLNIVGRRDHELNRLSDCRKNWEETLRIRKLHLHDDHILIGTILHNLGNLETATGHLEEAIEYYEQATSIYLKGGDRTTFQLALTDLSVGRVYMLQYKFAEARSMIARSEALLVRVLGTDRGFTVHVHYAYGNLEFLQANWEGAAREYEMCLKIALAEMPIHPITAAAYYSLACVEFEIGHPDNAKGYLDKARAIAELRSPTRDDGTIARILWKTAVVMESDTFGKHSSAAAVRTYAAEAADLRHRAEVARLQLLAGGEGGVIPFVDEGIAERNQEEDSYDVLIPLYFR